MSLSRLGLVIQLLILLAVPVEAREKVLFPDLGLEKAVRVQIGKATEELLDKDLQSVHDLDASGYYIENLSGIGVLSNLKRVDFSKNLIHEITPLSELKGLIFLSLDRNEIEDLTPLAEMTSLETLSAQSNQIASLMPLLNLVQLTELDVSENLIEELSPLQSMKALTYLDLSRNRISTVDPLKDLEHLKWLNLSSNNIGKIDALGDLQELSFLGIKKNPIEGEALKDSTVQRLVQQGVNLDIGAMEEKKEERVHRDSLIQDPKLEEWIRILIHVPDGKLTSDDLLLVKKLDSSTGWKIETFEGI